MPAYCCAYNYKNNRETRRRLNSYMKPHVISMIFVPTTWRRNVITIDIAEITRSQHPMYMYMTTG